MPGILRQSEDIIQAVAPEWTTIRVVPRGTPRFVDQNLRGIARYALRVGSFLPNLQPDNRTQTTSAIQALSQEISVSRIVDGLVPGSLVQIDQNEIQLVADVIRDELKILTFNVIKSNYASGVSVDLFAESYVSTGDTTIAQPKASKTFTQGSNVLTVTATSGGLRGNRIRFSIVVPTQPLVQFKVENPGLDIVVTLATNGASVPITQFQQVVDYIRAYLKGLVTVEFTGTNSDVPSAIAPTYLSGGTETNILGVRGKYPVLIGDQLWIQSDTSLLLSGQPYNVIGVQGYSMSLSSYNSIVVLDNPIPRDLAIEDVVYLRAFPGYRSNVVNIPAHRRLPHPLGPFVVDYFSGRFTDGQSPVETLSLQTFDGLDNPIDSTYPEAVEKNTPVLRVPIHQSAFLFFHRYCGTITYRNDKFVMRNDENGRCEIWVDLIPNWPAPAAGEPDLAWSTRVTFVSPEQNSIFYRFDPNEVDRVPGFPNQLLPAASGSSNNSANAQFSLKAGQQNATRLRIITSGQPNAEVEFDSWNVVGQQVEKLQYGLTAKQVGAYDWQAGSLQIKPYFKTLADLYTQMDVDSLDSGSLML